jgi:ActR/RegA family two-component response regulator
MTEMKEHVHLDGLLFSSDAQVLCVMNRVLESFAIKTEVCSQLGSALDAVNHRRLDTVIVDWNGAADPTRVVHSTRKSSPNSNSTIVAMVDGGASETHALLAGANFMIHKPVDIDHAQRCMRAAYGTMLQQRRRSARVSVDISVVAKVSGLGMLDVKISDLSIGGLALQCGQPLPLDREVSLLFPLPGTADLVRITGKVVNADAKGRAGVRFSFLPEGELGLFQNWLGTELAKLENAEIPVNGYVAVTDDRILEPVGPGSTVDTLESRKRMVSH